MRFLLFISAFLLSTLINADTLKPFVSDGCSAFPDGTFDQKELWLGCCYAHDYSYWQGGTYDQRLVSDRQLQACVAEVGEPDIALVMLAGVRVGGSPYFPTEFRWGYGWSYPKLYGQLTESELQQISNATDQPNAVAAKPKVEDENIR
ncbi:MAG: hypothetical protein ACJA0N_001195 [Pseudohongiellaceae bacterium]|jgi:hypothetical protein